MDENCRADLLEDVSKLGFYRKLLKTCVCCKHFTFGHNNHFTEEKERGM